MKSRYHDLDRHESPHCEPKFLPFHWRQRTRAKPDRQNGSVTPSVGLQLLVFQQHTSIALPPSTRQPGKPLRVLLLQGSLVGWGRHSRSPLQALSRPRGAPHPLTCTALLDACVWPAHGIGTCTGDYELRGRPLPAFPPAGTAANGAMRCRHPDACCFTPSQ